jgi:hypothetical protein
MPVSRASIGVLVACAVLASGAAVAQTNRSHSIPVGIENVNDSPLKAASYRALLRFVPDSTITISRFYFGFKLRGAACWDAGNAGYGSGDGGLLKGSLVQINASTGLPGAEIVSETVNGCTRHNQAMAEVNGNIPVLNWVNTPATLQGGTMYAVIISNAHADPVHNFFSFNAPLADLNLAGPHARNELDMNSPGGILSLDPREHVAWSEDGGASWSYGFYNGQYRSYMNDYDFAHPATRMPQYGFRLSNGTMLAMQPYYAYSEDCRRCTVAVGPARYARTFTELGGFTASGTKVGTLTLTNTSTGASGSCTPPEGYGAQTCTLSPGVSVAVGQAYTIKSTGTVELMEMDASQRLQWPDVGTPTGRLPYYQPKGNNKDVPNIWAGPVSSNFP